MSSDTSDCYILDEKSDEIKIKVETPNSATFTRRDQSQIPPKKEVQERVEESHRIIRELRKVPYKELSQREKIKYELEKQGVRDLPELLPNPGRSNSKPASRKNRDRPRRRRPRSKSSERRSGADKASESKAEPTITKQFEEHLKRDSKHLSKEEYKELLVRKLENAKQAVLSDYEKLKTGDKLRVDHVNKSSSTLWSRTFKREDEGERSAHISTPSKSSSEIREYRTRWETPVMAAISTKETVGGSTDTQGSKLSIKREKGSSSETAKPESCSHSTKKPKSDGMLYSKRSVHRVSEQDDEEKLNSMIDQLESAKKRLAMVAKQNPSTDVSAPDVDWIQSKKVQKERGTRWDTLRSKAPDTLATSSKSSSSSSVIPTSYSTAMPKNPMKKPKISVADFAKVPNEEELQVPVVDGNTQIKEGKKQLQPDVEEEENSELITVEEHLQVAIVDGFNPGKQLDAEQWAFIERKLLYCLDEMLLRTPGPYPIFDEMTSIKGYKILACCNDFTLQWLKGKIAEMAPPWVGARLNVVTKKELPTGPLVKINLPGPPISKKRLEQFIRNLNPEFPSQDWQVIQMKDNITDNGQEAIVMFNKESMAKLPDRGYKIRVGISVVKVEPLDPVYRKQAEAAAIRSVCESHYIKDSDDESTKSECWDSPTE